MVNMVSIEAITDRVSVRRVKASGVERLKEKITKLGFQPQHPLLVVQNEDGTCELLDGNHRLEAAKALGIGALPVHVITEVLTDNDKKRLARQANESTEAMIPTTFVDDAEFIWGEVDGGKTQDEIADIVGWKQSKVSNFALLKKINSEAWEIISTTFQKEINITSKDVVDDMSTTVDSISTASPFTERLLRDILSLEADQQLELVTELATNKDFKKGKFKQRAENYKARNEAFKYAEQQLGQLGEAYATRLVDVVYSGAYDTEWISSQDEKKKEYGQHPKLDKLIQSLRDEWEQKNSIHPIEGNFYEEVKKQGSGSIDLILTDPPYNIARENEFELDGRSNISQDFGEWDKYSEQQFISSLSVWAAEWARVLRDQGSGYVFTSDSYISHLRAALEAAGLHVKATIIWHKSNPGTQVVKTNFKSSVEYILFFTKGEGGHTFNWQGENEMHNFIEAPICGGKERLVDAKGNILHPTQKPERVLQHFVEISSNRGDTIFDGFMGVGSTGAVAKKLGRKFIGIEQDKVFFEAAQRRLAE